jgi:hypothetical protein
MARNKLTSALRMLGILAIPSALLLDASAGLAERPSGEPSSQGEIVATKSRVINGERFTFRKQLGEDGELQTVVVGPDGHTLPEHAVPRARRETIDPDLRARLDQMKSSELVRVNIALDLGGTPADETRETGEVVIRDGLAREATVNGVAVSDRELDQRQRDRQQQAQERRVEQLQQKAERLQAFARRQGLESRQAIEQAIEEGRETVTIELTRGAIEGLSRSRDAVIRGIELHQPGEDDIASAMNATSISTSALPYSSTRGNDIGIFMTESGCASERRVANYDRLSGTETNHSRNVVAILRAVSPDSQLYCRGGAVLPTSADLFGTFVWSGWSLQYVPPLSPPIEIVTRSNSTNDNTSFTTLDRDWDNFVYNMNIPIFNSGGNTGDDSGNVRSPAKGLNVIHVGNYDDADDTINSSSPFRNPETGNAKPEIVAPGTNVSAGGFSYSGTSQATPHAAAFTADMMSSSTYLKRKPYLVKAKLLAGGTDPISGGYDKVGLGGIDFASAHWSGNASWWTGDNSSFNDFAQNDGGTSGAYIEKRVYIGSYWDKARVVLSWLNRGSYTYDHRGDAHPIGMDLDMRVYDPYGRYVGGSSSWDNPFEKVEFSPTVSGYYTVKINRYANRDTALNLRMGLYVNYFNE